MVELTETERLFKSSLFRLEMDEMLKEVRPPDVSAARFAGTQRRAVPFSVVLRTQALAHLSTRFTVQCRREAAPLSPTPSRPVACTGFSGTCLSA
jgi:hypothetical protein